MKTVCQSVLILFFILRVYLSYSQTVNNPYPSSGIDNTDVEILLPDYNTANSSGISIPFHASNYHVAGNLVFNIFYDDAVVQDNHYSSISTVIKEATNIWSQLLISDVPIKVQVHKTTSQSFLASATSVNIRPSVSSPYFTNTYYPLALANKITGSDLGNGATNIDITINWDHIDGFYYGIDGNTPSNKFDLETCIIHELAHGLGFSSYVNVNTSGVGTYLHKGSPYVLDHFIRNSNNNYTVNETDNSSDCGSFLQSDDLFFSDNSSNIKVFAPTTWVIGSSYKHTDPNAFPNDLMNPKLLPGVAIHDPGQNILKILNDIGWTAPTPTGDAGYVQYTSTPSTFQKNSTVHYSAQYVYGDDNATVVSWGWKYELFDKSAGPITFDEGIGSGTGINGTINFSFNSGDMMDSYNYIRDRNGNLACNVRLTVKLSNGGQTHVIDNPGFIYNPEEPVLVLNNKGTGANSLSFSYYSDGASSYKIYYDTQGLGLYNGTGAHQGSSPITVANSNATTFTLTGLDNTKRYYISVKGVNAAGESDFSNEINAVPRPPDPHQPFPSVQNRTVCLDEVFGIFDDTLATNNFISPQDNYTLEVQNLGEGDLAYFTFNHQTSELKMESLDIDLTLVAGSYKPLENTIYLLTYRKPDQEDRSTNVVVKTCPGDQQIPLDPPHLPKVNNLTASGKFNQLSVFPNPAAHTLQIVNTGNAVLTKENELRLVDISGRVVKTILCNEDGNQNSIAVNIEELNNGFYFLQVLSGNKIENNYKVLIHH